MSKRILHPRIYSPFADLNPVDAAYNLYTVTAIDEKTQAEICSEDVFATHKQDAIKFYRDSLEQEFYDNNITNALFVAEIS